MRLDDKPVRTPAGRLLAAPTLALAEALAAEWEAQRDVIDPAKMPLTRLANSIIDGVSERSAPVAEEVARYLASDAAIRFLREAVHGLMSDQLERRPGTKNSKPERAGSKSYRVFSKFERTILGRPECSSQSVSH